MKPMVRYELTRPEFGCGDEWELIELHITEADDKYPVFAKVISCTRYDSYEDAARRMAKLLTEAGYND